MNGPLPLLRPCLSGTLDAMGEQTVRKTYQYKLQPTPAQELEQTLRLCRTLYNCVLEQRPTWWGRGQRRAKRATERIVAEPRGEEAESDATR